MPSKSKRRVIENSQQALTNYSKCAANKKGKLSNLPELFAVAVRLESERSSLETATTIAIEAAVINNYIDLRGEVNNMLQDYSERLLDELIVFRGKQNEYRKTLEPVDGLEIGLRLAPGEESRLEQIRGELRQKRISDDVMKWATADELNCPELEFDSALQVIPN